MSFYNGPFEEDGSGRLFSLKSTIVLLYWQSESNKRMVVLLIKSKETIWNDGVAGSSRHYAIKIKRHESSSIHIASIEVSQRWKAGQRLDEEQGRARYA